MCDIWRESGGRRLSITDIEGWLPDWRRLGVVRVVLCGEPLLHPDLMPMCRIIRAAGIRVDILTNGLLLKRRAGDIKDACDALTVSLDGPPKIHDEVRGRADAFARLERGVLAVKQVAPDLGVDARCAVHGLNYRSLRATVDTARALGLRSISFSGTDLHNEAAFRREDRVSDAYVRSLAISGRSVDALAEEVRLLEFEYAEDFRSGFISDPPHRLRRILVDYYRALDGQIPTPAPRCNAPWTSAVIEYDGTVRPCFPLSPYGNLFEHEGLDAVLNSAEARERRRLLDVASDPTCAGCVCQSDIQDEVAQLWSTHRADPAIRQLNAVTEFRAR